MDNAQLKAIAASLETKAGAATTANDGREGYWKRIAAAAETLAGASTIANASLEGYMLRSAKAFEALSATSGAEESDGYTGFLKRIVDALEVKSGAVGTSDMDSRLVTAAANAAFDLTLGFDSVLLVAGQSNAGGRGSGARANYTPTADVVMWNGSSFVTYTPGTASGYDIAGSAVTGTWGPEAEYARQWVAKYPGRKLYIVKGYRDGTNLAGDWNPSGSNYYSAFTTIVNNARAAIPNPKTRMVMWVQGEADALVQAQADAYQTNFTAFLPAARTSWSVGTAPFAVVRLARDTTAWTYGSTVRTAQAAATTGNNKLVNADDIMLDVGDGQHYGNYGQTQLGARLWALDQGAYAFAELPLSYELVKNGTNLTTTDYYTASPTATLSAVGGRLRVLATGADSQAATQDMSNFVIGATYRFTAELQATEANKARVQFSGGPSTTYYTAGTDVTIIDQTFVAGSAAAQMILGAASGGAWATAGQSAYFANISMMRVP